MIVSQLKTLERADGSVVTYRDHPELRAAGRIQALLDWADTMMRAGRRAARSEEPLMFKALHACGCAVQKSRGEKGYARRTRTALEQLHQRIQEYLVGENLGLVYTMRKCTRIAGLDPDDLFSEGQWRLLQAVHHYDPWLGFRFSTYACTSILRGFASLSRKKQSESATIERFCSLAPVSQGSESETSKLDDQWLAEQIRDLVLGESAKLAAIEQFVIVRRLLHTPNTTPDTLQSIGATFRLSKERIRQIQLTALEKLRRALSDNEHRWLLADRVGSWRAAARDAG